MKKCLLICSCNLSEWEHGPLKGRLINEPFVLNVDNITHLFEVINKVDML